MKEDLSQLVALQNIDLQIKKLEDEMSSDYADIETRQISIAEKREQLNIHTSTIEEGEQRRRELEAEMEDEIVHIKDRQTKLMNVQTNREYQSLLKEIEEAKKLNKTRETEIVDLMEQAERLQTKITEQNNICQAEEDLLNEAKAKVDDIASGIDKKKVKFQKKRNTQAKKIKASLLRRYDQLREKRNGLAITGVTTGVCQGCYMNIPPQQFNEVMRGDQLLSCPTCQRMMFHQPKIEEE